MEELLLQLKKDYLASIPEKICELQQLFAKGQQAELRNAFHRLKGSGQTYGVPAITLIAKEMERLCGQSELIDFHFFKMAITLLTTIHQGQIQTNKELSSDKRFQALVKIK